MTQLSLQRLLTAAVVAVVGLAAPAARAAELPELRYFPADVAVVAFIDVGEVLAFGLERRLETLQPRGKAALRSFEEGTGIDLEADVDTLVVGILPRGEGTAAVALARGRFDAERIEAYALERGGVGESYQGVNLIAREKAGGSSALALLPSGLIAAGETEAVRRVIDCLRGAENAAADAGLKRRVAGLAGATGLWAVGRLDRLPGQLPLPQPLSSTLSSVEWFSLSARLEKDVAASLRFETGDVDSGAELRQALASFLATARVRVAESPTLRAFLDSVELGGSGQMASLSLRLSAEFLDSLSSAAGRPTEP